MPQPDITSHVRKAASADFDQLTAVWEASVRATHHFLSEEVIQYLKPLVRNEYLAAVSLFCLKEGPNNIIGFAGVVEDKLEMLFVHPAHHGKGAGKTLLQFAINQLGIGQVDVNEQNVAAVHFYQHFGFQIKDRSDTDALGKPYPILHMVLQKQTLTCKTLKGI